MLLAAVPALACTVDDQDQSPAVQQTKYWPGSDSAQTDVDLLEPGQRPDSLSALDRFIVSGLRRIGRSRADIIGRLGEPDSVQSQPTPNRHVPGQIDSLVQLHYADLRVVIYQIATGQELIASIEVESNDYLRQPVPRVGTRWADVVALFGEPHSQDASGFRYSCRSCVVEQQVVFKVRDRVVTSIGFAYYVD